MTSNSPVHHQTPAPGHSLHHCRRTEILKLTPHHLVVDGGYYLQSDPWTKLPCNKPSLLWSDFYPPKSDCSFGNIFSVAICCILFDQTCTNRNNPTNELLGYCATYLGISVRAVTIVGDCLLVGLRGTAMPLWTALHTSLRTPCPPRGDLTREESVLYRFSKLAEECEYFHLDSKLLQSYICSQLTA